MCTHQANSARGL